MLSRSRLLPVILAASLGLAGVSAFSAEEDVPEITEDQEIVMDFLASGDEITVKKLLELGTITVNGVIVNHYLEKNRDSDVELSWVTTYQDAYCMRRWSVHHCVFNSPGKTCTWDSVAKKC